MHKDTEESPYIGDLDSDREDDDDGKLAISSGGSSQRTKSIAAEEITPHGEGKGYRYTGQSFKDSNADTWGKISSRSVTLAEHKWEKRRKVRELIRTGSLLVLAVLAIGIMLVYLRFILVPLLVARFFVFMFQPLVDFLSGRNRIVCGRRCGLGHSLAVLSTLLLVVLAVLLIGFLIFISCKEIASNSEEYGERFNEFALYISTFAEEKGFKNTITKKLKEIDYGAYIWEAIMSVLDALPSFFLVILFTVYMLLSYDTSHVDAQEARPGRLGQKVSQQVRVYITIKIIVSLVTGICIGIVFLALRIKLAIVFALLAFFLNFIPNLGSLIATLIPIPIILLDPDLQWWGIVLALALPVCIQVVVAYIIEPRLAGKAMDMHPVAVLTALAFWAAVWGIVGAFLSIPLTVVFRLLLLNMEHPMPQVMGQVLGGDVSFFTDADEEESDIEMGAMPRPFSVKDV